MHRTFLHHTAKIVQMERLQVLTLRQRNSGRSRNLCTAAALKNMLWDSGFSKWTSQGPKKAACARARAAKTQRLEPCTKLKPSRTVQSPACGEHPMFTFPVTSCAASAQTQGSRGLYGTKPLEALGKAIKLPDELRAVPAARRSSPISSTASWSWEASKYPTSKKGELS